MSQIPGSTRRLARSAGNACSEMAPGGVEPPHADSKLGEPISVDLG